MLIYFPGKTFPSTTADHIYVRFLAHAFAKRLGQGFLLAVNGIPAEELEGIPTVSVSAPRRLRVLFYFFWVPNFLARNKYRGPEVAFFSNDLYILSILLFWKRLCGYRFRICSDWHLLTKTWRDRYVARGSDISITTSRRLKNQLISATGVRADRVSVVYGGVENDSYTLAGTMRREGLSLPGDKQLVAYVGNFKTLGKEKGVNTMLEALQHLPDSVYMVFVGGTCEEIQEYRVYAEQLEVQGRCIWIVHQSFAAIPQYEQSMDALVIPYPDEPHFRDYGFPMKVYEYLAAGVPIVYSRLEIMQEVLDGAGYAFTPGNPVSLAEGIQHALSAEARDIARKNTELAKEYSWEAKAGNIITAIRSVGAQI